MSTLGYLTMCHCGHHQDTHHEKKHACLGMRCDCPEYRDAEIPLPPKVRVEAHGNAKPANRPHADYSCKCPGCQEYDNRDYFYGWP